MHDAVLCLQMWLDGLSVGLYYGGVGNGIGGHQTRLGRQAKLRRRNEQRGMIVVNRMWEEHNETILSRMAAENRQLTAAPSDTAKELQLQRLESKQSCAIGGRSGRRGGMRKGAA